jgi:alanine racemase
MARARLHIDLDAIAGNWRALDAMSAASVETAAVLKADGYGLGAAWVGPALAAAGARTFFVALAEEGAALREVLGPGPAIYILSGPLPGDAELLRAFALRPCVNSRAQLERHRATAPDAPCALQIDSGMNRLGLEPAELAGAADAVAALDLRLVLSHLACADVPGHALNTSQVDAFAGAVAGLPSAPRSLAATGGILLGEAYHFDLTRPGIGLFGGRPFEAGRPVVRLSLPVIQVRDVAPGEAVGYGAAWTAPAPARIATLAAGYADGLLRAIGNGAVGLYAGGTRCPLVGRVSMDLITVDVSGLRDVPDHLDILGAHQGIDALADAAGTIGYEVLTSLGDRYERHYNGPAYPSDPA